MWLNKSNSNNLQMQFVIQNKITEYALDSINIELFNSTAFNQIALITHKDRERHKQELLIEKFLFANSEMLAYIPLCAHTNAKKALIHGTLNCEIAYLLAKQGLEVDFVIPNTESFFTLSGFFPHFKEITAGGENINIHTNFSSIKSLDYDIILHLGDVKKHELVALDKMANKDSIRITRLSNIYLEPSLVLDEMDMAGEFANILMPFSIPCIENEFYLFSSKRFHPLADLLLQKSDMLETKFYNSNLHASVFRMPTMIQNLIGKYAKN